MRFILFVGSSLLLLSGCSNEQQKTTQEKKVLEVKKEEKKQLKTEAKKQVLQRIDSGGYSYVEVLEQGKQYWIAGPQSDVQKGDFIEYNKQMVMPSFTSNTLQRTFTDLVFVSAIYKEDEKQAPATQTNPHPVAMQEITVKTASSGIKVVDLFAQKEKLKGSEVLFNAQVVKITKDVMDKDWIHLQDGSGEQGEHDIIATSKTTDLQVGDQVEVVGKLQTDLNLGSGYNYPAIIQEASFKAL